MLLLIAIVEFPDGYQLSQLTERETAVPFDHRNVLTNRLAEPGGSF
jgi:hypothetical protein